MKLRRRSPGLGVFLPMFALLGVMAACAGKETGIVAPLSQQPAAPAQPAPAASAPEPQAAPLPPAPVPKPQQAPAPKAVAAEPKYGGIAVFAVREDTPGWDPMRLTGVGLGQMNGPIFGSGNIVKPCREDVYNVCPALAERWEANSDFTQWTFKIRDNAVWHDGRPFTAEDARWWVELSVFGAQSGETKRLSSRHKGLFEPFKKVETLPENRLRITLERGVPIYPNLLASDPHHRIAHPPHLMRPLIEKGEVNVAPQDVGWVATGPFKMLKYERGVRTQVRRFDRYWEKDPQGRRLPFLDGIDLPIITDPSAMDAAFRIGRLDGGARGAGHSLTKERQAGYIRDLGDRVWFATYLGIPLALLPTTLHPGPLRDIRVRKAITLSIDRQAAIEVIGGFGEIVTILSPRSQWPDPEFQKWPGWNPATKEQDRAEARRLMKEAGYEKGFEAKLVCLRAWLERCVFVQGELARLGVNLKLDLVPDFGVWQSRFPRADYDFQLGGSCLNGGLPVSCADRLVRHSVNPNAHLKHGDPKVDDLVGRLRWAPTFDQQLRLYRELERYLLLEQVYHIPIWAGIEVVGYRSHIKGLIVPAENFTNNADHPTVWLDK